MSLWHRRAALEHGAVKQASQADTPATAHLHAESPVAVPAPTSVAIPPNHPLFDHAKAILSDMAATDANTAADAWDIYHQTRTPAELATRLQALPIPPQIAHALMEAKGSSQPKDVVDKILGTMMAIPKEALDLAESNPHVFGHFVKAALGKE